MRSKAEPGLISDFQVKLETLATKIKDYSSRVTQNDQNLCNIIKDLQASQQLLANEYHSLSALFTDQLKVLLSLAADILAEHSPFLTPASARQNLFRIAATLIELSSRILDQTAPGPARVSSFLIEQQKRIDAIQPSPLPPPLL